MERSKPEHWRYQPRGTSAGEIFARALLVLAILSIAVYFAVPKARAFVRHIAETIDEPTR